MHCVAAGAKHGEVAFATGNQPSTSFVALPEDGRKSSQEMSSIIRQERVDDIVPTSLPIFLFKTDTQGFEKSVLMGSRNILRKGDVFLVLIEFSYSLLHRAGTDPLELLDYVYDLGFVCTYMAIHTLKKSGFGMIRVEPQTDLEGYSVSFTDLVESIRAIDAPGASGHSGWTDLLCWKPNILSY